MAPEQCGPSASDTPGPASDVWGLGATLFEAVAGYRAFDEGDPAADEVAARFPQLTSPPHELPDRVPPEVGKIVYAALDADPAARPAQHEIAEALAPVLSRQPRRRLAGFKVAG